MKLRKQELPRRTGARRLPQRSEPVLPGGRFCDGK